MRRTRMRFLKKLFIICLVLAIVFIVIAVHFQIKLLPHLSIVDMIYFQLVKEAVAPLPPAPYPFMAYIFINSSKMSLNCAGTFIDGRHVLTAAHCVFGASSASVLLGTNNLQDDQSPTIKLESNTFIVHPSYNNTLHTNDIALVVLETEVTPNENVDFVSLFVDGDTTDIDGNYQVLGWPFLDPSRVFGDELVEKEVTLMDGANCNWDRREDGDCKFPKLCSDATSGAFLTHSGSALLFNGFQIGLVSRQEVDGLNKWMVYTNVDCYLSWIQENAQIF